MEAKISVAVRPVGVVRSSPCALANMANTNEHTSKVQANTVCVGLNSSCFIAFTIARSVR